MNDYLLAGALLVLGLGAVYFGVRNPRGDAWGPAWAYVFGGLMFAVVGLILLADQIGWL